MTTPTVANVRCRQAIAFLALGTLLALSGCSESPKRDRKSTGLAFAACAEMASKAEAPLPKPRQGGLDMSCATLTVPLDHANPARGSLEVAVVRVRATDPGHRIGSLVLNPGGPGVSGVDFMPSWATSLPDELLARFDLISFDPRGSGRSAPIRCPDRLDGAALPDLGTDAGWAAAQVLLRTRDQACADKLGKAAGLFSTDATARDLDLLREALGDEALTFVGWSYGARLGAQYARLFPGRVRALVLDAPPDPSASWDTIVESQIAGFEAAFTAYAAQCRSRETCARVDDARRLLDQVVEKARAKPIPSGRPTQDKPATWDVVLRSVLGYLFTPDLWPVLDGALTEAAAGDSGSLYDMIDSLEGRTAANREANASAALAVILCNDRPPAANPADLRAEAAELASDYPTFGEYGAWWLFACAYWTVPHQPLPTTALTVTSPVLVVGTSVDPATPYPGVTAFADSLGPKAVLLTWSGTGHTAFGRSPCVGQYVTAYLVGLRTPEEGTVCP
jgi:pimeloyl-ACP methyl ester carboxylesterase